MTPLMVPPYHPTHSDSHQLVGVGDGRSEKVGSVSFKLEPIGVQVNSVENSRTKFGGSLGQFRIVGLSRADQSTTVGEG